MSEETYRLEEQVGFLLRRVNQRHLAVFATVIPEVTTTQLAAMSKLAELGPMSQNQLGRVTAMDAATIKGVVGRLVTRRLVVTVPSEEDRRRLIVDLTPEGRALFASLSAAGPRRPADAGAAGADRAGALHRAAAAADLRGWHGRRAPMRGADGRRLRRGGGLVRGEGRLYWTDINRFLIHGSTRETGAGTWLFDEPVVALALTDRPGVLLAALASQLILLTPEADGREPLGPALTGSP